MRRVRRGCGSNGRKGRRISHRRAWLPDRLYPTPEQGYLPRERRPGLHHPGVRTARHRRGQRSPVPGLLYPGSIGVCRSERKSVLPAACSDQRCFPRTRPRRRPPSRQDTSARMGTAVPAAGISLSTETFGTCAMVRGPPDGSGAPTAIQGCRFARSGVPRPSEFRCKFK